MANEDEQNEWTEELLNMSYSNLRVYEDHETLCFLGNNPMLTECETAEKSAAFQALSRSIEQEEPKNQINCNVQADVTFIPRKTFRRKTSFLGSTSNDENRDPNTLLGEIYSKPTRRKAKFNPSKYPTIFPPTEQAKDFEYSNIYNTNSSNKNLANPMINSLLKPGANRNASAVSATTKIEAKTKGTQSKPSISFFSMLLKANICDIASYSSNLSSFILRASDSSLIITDSSQSVLTFTHYTVSDNRVFEWIRGVCISG